MHIINSIDVGLLIVEPAVMTKYSGDYTPFG